MHNRKTFLVYPPNYSSDKGKGRAGSNWERDRWQIHR